MSAAHWSETTTSSISHTGSFVGDDPVVVPRQSGPLALGLVSDVVVESSGEREDEPGDGLADRVAVDAGAVRQDDAGPDRVDPLVGQ